MSASAKIQHLSWSKLQCYRQCPRQFAYRYIQEAPAERKSAALVFGSAFHRAVESIHEARLEGAPYPTSEALIAVFNAEWQQQAGTGLPLEFPKTENLETQRETASRMLEAYLRFVVSGRANGEVLAIEGEGVFDLSENLPPFVTRLDLLERFGDELHITDLKTAKTFYDDQKIREVQLQLVAYAHSTMNVVRSLGIRKVVPKIELVTKTKTPRVQVIAPPTSQEDVARLKATVCEVWSAIEKGVFVRHESWQCKGCPFKDRCRQDP